MSFRDLLTAAVRTAVQGLAGWAVYELAERGIQLDQMALEGLLFAAATGAATLLLRWLETQLPWLPRILSLGLSTTGPTYTAKHAAP